MQSMQLPKKFSELISNIIKPGKYNNEECIYSDKNLTYDERIDVLEKINNDIISNNILLNIQDDINIFQGNEIKNMIWLSNIDFVPIIHNIVKEKVSINLSHLIITYLFYIIY